MTISYSYTVNKKEYTGHQYYNNHRKYRPFEAKEIRDEIASRPSLTIHYNQNNHQDSVVLLSQPEFGHYYALLIALVLGWIFWIGLYARLKKSDGFTS